MGKQNGPKKHGGALGQMLRLTPKQVSESAQNSGLRQVQVLARVHTEEAVETLVSIMRADPMLGKISPAVRVRAAEAILNQGWGRPPTNQGSGMDAAGGGVKLQVNILKQNFDGSAEKTVIAEYDQPEKPGITIE